MRLRHLNRLEAIGCVFLVSSKSRGFGTWDRIYSILNSGIELHISPFKWDDGVMYDLDDMNIFLRRNHNVDKEQISAEDMMFYVPDSARLDIIMNIDLFV